MTVLNKLFPTSIYTSLVDRERARIIYSVPGLLLGCLIFLSLTLLDATTGETIWQMAGHNATISLSLTGLLVFSAASYLLTRLGRIRLAALAVILSWAMSAGLGMAMQGFNLIAGGMALVTTLLLAGLLLGQVGLLLGTGFSLMTLFFGLSRRSQLPPDALTYSNLGLELLFGLLLILFSASVVYLFVRVSRLGREEGSLELVSEQERLADITVKISQEISRRRTLAATLDETIKHIVDDYAEVYHAQIYLLDEGQEKAMLVASTGEVGRHLLEARLSAKLDRLSVVGMALVDAVPVINRYAGGELRQRNPYLPETRTQVAFPLMVGSKVIGALDLHSHSVTAFAERQLPMFQILAAHTAITIDNARLVEETAQQLEANRTLVEQTQAALQQVEELNRRLTGQAWSTFLEANQVHRGLDLDFDLSKSQVNESWTPQLLAAARENRILDSEAETGRLISVPVRVRGQVIGAMEFEIDARSAISEDDRQLLEGVSERFGLAAENARLYEESRRIAQREALINEAGSRLQASSDVEKTLVEAARSLQEILKVNRVSIQLGAPPVAQSNGNGNGKDSAS